MERAKQLFRELVYDGINVDVMHADRTQVHPPTHCHRHLRAHHPPLAWWWLTTHHSPLTIVRTLWQAQRDRVIEQFRSGAIWVLICTDLMARGIDFKGVNLVRPPELCWSVLSSGWCWEAGINAIAGALL